MMLKEYITDSSIISIYEKYAIFSIINGKALDHSVATEIRKTLKLHFPKLPFVVIREEVNDLEVDFSVYKKRTLKNLKGLAIVSSNEKVRKRAIEEQSLFDDSFAFFNNMAAAKNWADSFVYI